MVRARGLCSQRRRRRGKKGHGEENEVIGLSQKPQSRVRKRRREGAECTCWLEKSKL